MKEYKVERAQVVIADGVIEERYFITENRIPMMIVCQWLDTVSINSILTGRHYAYCLVGFLRYIENLNISYKDIRNNTIIWNYLKKLMYENKRKNIIEMDGQKSYSSIYHNIGIIKSFYFWLDQYLHGVFYEDEYKSFTELSSTYLYADIWGTKFFKKANYSQYPIRMKYKGRRNSHRWYSEEEIECFTTAFNTKRDLAIFLISIEGGCRIEEILTIKHYDYFPNEERVWISESKTITRYIELPKYVCKIIDDYLNTEKFDLEINTDKMIDEYLFVNLKKGKNQGEKVSQANYRKILKRAGEKIGLNPKYVITHAGRSTKTQELIEVGCTDEEIMQVMGWSSRHTIDRYKKEFSVKLAKTTSDKVYKRSRVKIGDK